MLFCEKCEVLQNIIFREHCWATASDLLYVVFSTYQLLYQQYIAASFLGLSETATCKQSTLISLKIFKIKQKKQSRG